MEKNIRIMNKSYMVINDKRIRLIIAGLLIHLFTYWGTRLFTGRLYHFDLTTSLEERIPVLPWTVCIYFGCYIFWFINYFLGCTQEEGEAIRFIYSEMIAKSICCICYIVFPTTNIRPEIHGGDVCSTILLWLYKTDPADNLFPSIHCLTSWLSVIAVRKQERVPPWYRSMSVFFALLVCLSTLTLKQHVIADVIAGVFLGELSYRVSGLSKKT